MPAEAAIILMLAFMAAFAASELVAWGVHLRNNRPAGDNSPGSSEPFDQADR